MKSNGKARLVKILSPLSGLTLVLIVMIIFNSSAAAARILVKEGMRGEAVRHVQELLIAEGYLEGEADGVCGTMTVTAIKAFQEANNLEVDGILGAGTYHILAKGEEYNLPAYTSIDGTVLEGTPMQVEATAYSAYDPGNGNMTATGTLLRRGIIAVDPWVIPLGTRVYIPNYGEAVAEDVGGAIKGNRIDIAFDSHEEAIEFGRQYIEIVILD